MYVNPGELNKKIQIIKLDSYNKDSAGFEVDAQETVVWRCWAKLTTQSGTELTRSGSEFTETKQRFLIRSTETEIAEDMIVRYAGKDYNIIFLNTYGDSKEYTEIWTEKKERK